MKITISDTYDMDKAILNAGYEAYQKNPLKKISMADVRKFRREFLRHNHANSSYIREWYNGLTRDEQHSWNCLVDGFVCMLNMLEFQIDIRVPGDNLDNRQLVFVNGKLKWRVNEELPEPTTPVKQAKKKSPEPVVNVQLNIFDQMK